LPQYIDLARERNEIAKVKLHIKLRRYENGAYDLCQSFSVGVKVSARKLLYTSRSTNKMEMEWTPRSSEYRGQPRSDGLRHIATFTGQAATMTDCAL